MSALQELIDLLALERIEDNLFGGRSQDLGWSRVYGGQVLGQALSAAEQTVPPERAVHSLHGYFLRPGDSGRPIVYEVDRIRDGKSFTTRRVVAIQKGRAIFNMAASFHIDEGGFEHHAPAPEVPGPEGLRSDREWIADYKEELPQKLRDALMSETRIEARPVEGYNLLDPQLRKAQRHVWFRAAHALPDDPRLHRYLLAYASDSHFLTTSLHPHGKSWLSPGMQVASIDHAMWFHRPFRVDDWLLYSIDSPNASGGRGLVHGRFYNREGLLVATATQEGLIRQREPS